MLSVLWAAKAKLGQQMQSFAETSHYSAPIFSLIPAPLPATKHAHMTVCTSNARHTNRLPTNIIVSWRLDFDYTGATIQPKGVTISKVAQLEELEDSSRN
jgi:hypothetical protein